jgi:predicted metal-dependent phosphoesterase TrpH
MFSIIDLHIHSKEGSDGRYTVGAIFRIAQARGVQIISITDHDSTEALYQAIQFNKKYEVKLVTGIEFSVIHHDKELHLLGYSFDYTNTILQATLKDLRIYREWRITEIVKRLNEALEEDNLQPLTHRDVEEIKRSADGTVGRPHIARYLLDRGYVISTAEAFGKYLTDCDVPKKYLTIQSARDLMDAADGQLFLAHPAGKHQSLRQFSNEITEQTDIIEPFLPFLDGIECYYSDHTEAEAQAWALYTQKKKKMMSSGSDCHQDPIKLGTVLLPKDEEKIIFTQFSM